MHTTDDFGFASPTTRPQRAQPVASLLALGLIFLGGCGGGGGGSTPTAPPMPTAPQTISVSGTARALGPGSCSGDSHDFQAAEGAISVTLVQTTGGVKMGVQVCAGGIDNNNCSINLQPIVVGQTVAGTRVGAAGQNLKFNTANCGGGGTAPATPIDYTATLTFQR